MINKYLINSKEINSPLGVKIIRNNFLLELFDKWEKIFAQGEKITYMELEQLYIDLVTARYAGNYLTAVFNQILEYKIVNTELQFICTKLNIKQNIYEVTVIEETNKDEDVNINEDNKNQKKTRKRSKRKLSKKKQTIKSKTAKRVEEDENEEVKKEYNANSINDLWFETGYQTDNPDLDERSHFSRIDKWRHVLSKRISLLNFTSIFERAKNMIVKAWINENVFNHIIDKWEKFKQKWIEIYNKCETPQKGNKIIDLIHEGLNWNVVDFEVVIEAINKFSDSQKLWDLYSKYFDSKATNILYDEYESFIDVIYQDIKSKGLLSIDQISQIENDYKMANTIIKKIKTLKSKKIKDIHKFVDEYKDFCKIKIPEFEELKTRLIIMKLLDESKIENPTPVCLSLLEVDSILRSLNCQISPYSGIDHKRARTVIDLKLKYTRKIIKKHNENTLEGLSEIISTLHRDQGIIPLDLYTKYENRKQSSEWYAQAIETVNSNSIRIFIK